jgi:hypothetical protein
MTKLEQRALCDWAVTQHPITRIPAGTRNYSARAMRSLERDPRSRASLDARRGALRRAAARRAHGDPRGRRIDIHLPLDEIGARRALALHAYAHARGTSVSRAEGELQGVS